MKHITVLAAVICACLAHLINGLPQQNNWKSSDGWQQWGRRNPNINNNNSNNWQRNNGTRQTIGANHQPRTDGWHEWQGNNNNNFQSNNGTSQTIGDSHQHKSDSWQESQRRNKATGNPTNYNTNNVNNNNNNNNWQSSNGTPQAIGRSYQPEGERIWLTNNQSHPYFQVPGFGNRRNFPATPQASHGIAGGTQRNNSSSQNVKTTPQSVHNNGWHGNSTVVGQRFPQSNLGGWVTPVNLAINTNRKGAASNGVGGWSSTTNHSNNNNLQNQWDNSYNSHSKWNPHLPASSLVIGNNAPSTYGTNGAAALAPIAGSSQSNAVSGGNALPSWNPGSTVFGFTGAAQLEPLASEGNNPLGPGSVGGGTSSGTPMAPMTGGPSWNSNGQPSGLSSAGGQRQAPSHYPGYSNPYANLFIV